MKFPKFPTFKSHFFNEVVHPILMFTFLGWIFLTIILNLLLMFFPSIIELVGKFDDGVAVINIVVIGIAIFITQRKERNFDHLCQFFEEEKKTFIKLNSGIQDPLALNALKTNVGSFLSMHALRCEQVKKNLNPMTTKAYLILFGFLVFFSVFAIFDFKWKLLIAPMNQDFNSSGIVLDFGLMLLAPSGLLWATTVTQFINLRELNKWRNNLFGHFATRKQKELSDPYRTFDRIEAKKEILEYFEVSSFEELLKEIDKNPR